MKRKMVCLLTALVSVALILASCGGQSGEKTSAAGSSGAEFIIGNGAEPQSLDPAKIQGIVGYQRRRYDLYLPPAQSGME